MKTTSSASASPEPLPSNFSLAVGPGIISSDIDLEKATFSYQGRTVPGARLAELLSLTTEAERAA